MLIHPLAAQTSCLRIFLFWYLKRELKGTWFNLSDTLKIAKLAWLCEQHLNSMRTSENWFYIGSTVSLWMVTMTIQSMHPSESVTIAVFWGEKEESQLDEKENAFNTFNRHDNIYSPFRPLSLSWIPVRSVALAVILVLHALNIYVRIVNLEVN